MREVREDGARELVFSAGISSTTIAGGYGLLRSLRKLESGDGSPQ
jgi:hypothetical protein